MGQNILKYITPLRIVTLIMLVQLVTEYNITERALENGDEPGLGGLGYLILGFFTIISFFLDLILSLSLNKEKNWLIQAFISVIIFFFIMQS